MTDTHADAHGDAHAVPKHPYHLVDPSPWPIVGAIAAGLLATGGVLFIHGHVVLLMLIGFIAVPAPVAVRWRHVTRAATLDGHHNAVVQLRLRDGISLFIASE